MENENLLLEIGAEEIEKSMVKNKKLWEEIYTHLITPTPNEALDLYFKYLSETITNHDLRRLKKYSLVKFFKEEVPFLEVYFFHNFYEFILNKKFEDEVNPLEAKGHEIYEKYCIVKDLCKVLKLKGSMVDGESFNTEMIEDRAHTVRDILKRAKDLFPVPYDLHSSYDLICGTLNVFRFWSNPNYKKETKVKWSKGKRKNITVYTVRTSFEYMLLRDKLVPLTIDLLFDVLPYFNDLINEEQKSRFCWSLE